MIISQVKVENEFGATQKYGFNIYKQQRYVLNIYKQLHCATVKCMRWGVITADLLPLREICGSPCVTGMRFRIHLVGDSKTQESLK